MRRRCGWRAKLGRAVDAAEGDVGRRKLLDQRIDVERAERRGDPAVGLGAALHPLDVGGEIRIGGERLVAHHLLGQHAPLAVALDRDQNVGAVLGLEHAVGRDRGVREADALRRHAALVLQQRRRHPVRHAVEHRHRDRRALAGAAARDQRLQHRLVGVHAGADVADRDADARRRLRPAGDGGDAGLGLDQHVVGLARGVGAGVAVARDRADDQPRVVAAQPLDGEAELGRPRRA